MKNIDGFILRLVGVITSLLNRVSQITLVGDTYKVDRYYDFCEGTRAFSNFTTFSISHLLLKNIGNILGAFLQ